LPATLAEVKALLETGVEAFDPPLVFVFAVASVREAVFPGGSGELEAIAAALLASVVRTLHVRKREVLRGLGDDVLLDDAVRPLRGL
jgi:hypothetical protein